MAIEVNTVPGMTPSTVLIQQVTLFVIHPTVSSVSICFRKYIYKIEKRVKRSRDIELINTFFSFFKWDWKQIQALAEQPPMYPPQFFRTLLNLAAQRVK